MPTYRTLSVHSGDRVWRSVEEGEGVEWVRRRDDEVK